MRIGRFVVLIATLGVTAACAASSSGSASGGSAASPPTASPHAPSSTARPSSYIEYTARAGSKPCAVEGGFGSIWVSVYGSSTELRIDPTTHKVLARIPVGKGPCGIAVGAGSVWVEDFVSNQVSRIDPKTDQATAIAVGSGPYDVTFAAGAAWVTNYNDDTVSRVDAATGRATTIKVGASPTGVAPAAGAVWVTDKGDGTIARIDPTTLAVRKTRVGDVPAWTAWGDGELWLADGNGIDQVDLATGRSSHQVQLGATVNDGDIVDGKVWVTDAAGDLHEIDARTGQDLGRWATRLANPFVLAGYAGALWVVDFNGTKLEEIDPSRLS